MNANWTTIAQSQVRERNSCQPSRELAEEVGAPLVAPRGSRISARSERGDEVGAARRSRAPSPEPTAGDEQAAERGAADLRRVHRQAQQRVRLLEQRSPARSAGRSRPRPGRRTRTRRRARAASATRCQISARPGEQQRGGHACASAADDVRADHHVVPRQPVGPDPADEQEDDLRDHRARRGRARGRGRRAGQVEHGERERDRRDRAAEERDGAAEEEEAEVALAQRRDVLTPHACPSSASARRRTARTASRGRTSLGLLGGRSASRRRDELLLGRALARRARAHVSSRSRSSREVPADVVRERRSGSARAARARAARSPRASGTRPRRRCPAAASAAARARLGWIRTPAASPA